MKQLILECEDDIENNTGAKHESISRKIDNIFDKPEKMKTFIQKLGDKVKVDENCLEFAGPVNVQSGGQYNLKLDAISTNQKLSQDTILLTVCGKYKDIACNASRTMLINPVPEQKTAYEFLFDLIKFIFD